MIIYPAGRVGRKGGKRGAWQANQKKHNEYQAKYMFHIQFPPNLNENIYLKLLLSIL